MSIIRILTFLTMLNIISISLLAQQSIQEMEKQHTTYITGKIGDNHKYDTLSLILHGHFFYNGIPERGAVQTLTTTADKKGEFKFEILTGNSPFHISLFLSSKRNNNNGLLLGIGDIPNYLIEPGDSIHITFDNHAQHYTGKGSDLFYAQYYSNKIVRTGEYGDAVQESHNYFLQDIEKWMNLKDSLLNVQLTELSTYQQKLSSIAYNIVRANLIGANRSLVYARINSTKPFILSKYPIGQDLEKIIQRLKQRPAYIDQSNRASLSPKYIEYLYRKMVVELKHEKITNNVNTSDNNYFFTISQQYTGILRDKLLVFWLKQMSSINQLLPEYIANSFTIMQHPIYINLTKELEATYSKGQPLKDFNFQDAKGKTVHLADFKGKVLLIDLWFTGCTGCILVAAGLPKVEEAFNNRTDIAFISISIDKDRAIWLNSISRNPKSLNYTHFITPRTIYLYTGGTGQSNPFIKTYVPEGSYPSLLIIDREGTIFSSTPSRPVSIKGRENLIKEIKQALVEK